MKGNPINLVVPPGANTLTLAFGEKMTENDDTVREAFAQAEKNGTASVSLRQPEDLQKAAGLDYLRELGTPIELVHSALVADDAKVANDMFRTSILEYFYEKIQATYPNDTVRFICSRSLHREDEKLGVLVDGAGQGIAFTPEFDNVPFDYRGFVPLCTLDGGHIHQVTTDSGNAAVLAIIETLTDYMFEDVLTAVDDATDQLGAGRSARITFHIAVDLGHFSISREKDGFSARASVPVAAYFTPMN
jgi:hypothetical protein